MKTKRYPHVTGLYGDEGENPSALAIHAVLDPSPNYPESGRIIVGSPATTPTIDGYIPNLGGFNGGPAAIERLAATLLEAARDARAAMGSTAAPPADAPRESVTLDLDDLERKARAATRGEWAADRVPGTPRDAEPIVANVIALDLDDAGRQQQVADCYDNTHYSNELCEANAAHIAANSPPVALALIARIRELEDIAKDYAGDLASEGYDRQAEAVRKILERGAVLP